jgi:5-formyltetrahydrofolate cyclo-ligase
MEGVDLSLQKRELRERMRRTRSGIPPAERAVLAARAEARLLALPELQEARTVLLFYSFGSEIPTAVLIRRLLQRRSRVLLPYLSEEGMEAGEVLPGETLVETDYGPKEPTRRVAVDPSGVDVVVTPGLAFDRRGHRLGYGGGHYDRYLARLHAGAVRMGIGFSAQVLDELPADEYDQPVDVVITDKDVIRIRA